MLGLRTKLFIAFGGLFTLLILVAGLSIAVIDGVSRAFDQIFHENLETIQACRGMAQSLQEMDEALLVALWENTVPESTQVEKGRQEFERNLRFQKGNITVPGETELTDSLNTVWLEFSRAYSVLLHSSRNISERRDLYRKSILAPYSRIGDFTQRIADLNAGNILSADGQVRARAKAARRTMYGLLVSGGVLVLLLLGITHRLVLQPIRSLMRSAQEIEKGNLDLTLQVRSRDEIGKLAEAFNAMAARLREFRRSDRAKLILTQRTTQMAINSLPDAVAVITEQGIVEISNDPARELFGIKPGIALNALGRENLAELFDKVRRTLRPFSPPTYESAMQVFRAGEERFFLPHAIPIVDEGRQLTGVTLVLADVTELRKLDEAKSDLIATVSHELKTRLTSMRMAVHLLLDEKIGDLNARQSELLFAAREDAEHLHRTIEGLLDLGRIRSGQLKMEVSSLSPHDLIAQSMDSMRHAFQDKGLSLEENIPHDLPPVWADSARAPLILNNLLSNALKYTLPGGQVRLSAEAREDGMVQFSVADTGIGIPSEDLPRIFERFYRGKRGREAGGAGLGLAIAREVVEAHGGTLTAASREGQGSTFTFTLRRADTGPA